MNSNNNTSWAVEAQEEQLLQHILSWIDNDAIAAAIRDTLGIHQDIDHTIDLLLSNEDLINAIKNQKGSTSIEEFNQIKDRILAIPPFIYAHCHGATPYCEANRTSKVHNHISLGITSSVNITGHSMKTVDACLPTSKYINLYNPEYYYQYSTHDLDAYIQCQHYDYHHGDTARLINRYGETQLLMPWQSRKRYRRTRTYLLSYTNAVRRSKNQVWDSDFVHKVRQGHHGRRHDPPEPIVGSTNNNMQPDDNVHVVHGETNNIVQDGPSSGNDTSSVSDDVKGDDDTSADTHLTEAELPYLQTYDAATIIKERKQWRRIQDYVPCSSNEVEHLYQWFGSPATGELDNEVLNEQLGYPAYIHKDDSVNSSGETDNSVQCGTNVDNRLTSDDVDV